MKGKQRRINMLYGEFINDAINLTITQSDNGLYYLEPMWRIILIENDLRFDDVTDYEIDADIVKDALQLEVEKRNAINSNSPFIINWLFNIIAEQIEPAILSEETDYIKQVIEFMKANHSNSNKPTDKDTFKNS